MTLPLPHRHISSVYVFDANLTNVIETRYVDRGNVNDMAFDGVGNMFYSCYSGNIYIVTPDKYTKFYVTARYIFSLRVTVDFKLVFSFYLAHERLSAFHVAYN